MKKIAKILIVTFLVSLPGLSFAQNVIKGHIADALSGEPIIGATISLGNGKGTTTDIDGNFNLNIKKELPVSVHVDYIGYYAQDIDVYDSEEPLKLALRERSKYLDGVVIVGYGTQRREQLTGSVTTVSSDIFDVSPAPTLDVALAGQVAGLNITASSGQPGAASQIRIRGGNSVNASNEPLYVIDGFIYYKEASDNKTGLNAIESSLSPLASVNPQDIESVEVLKDVSATAIYGSRGANGVIIVTTKKGKAGKTNINYRYTIGFDTPAKKLDLLNASEWASLQKSNFYNKGGYTDEDIAALGIGTDWQDAVMQTGLRQSHELSISGGTEKGHYAVSTSYNEQDGVVINSGFRRYNFHINADHELLENLKFGVNASAGKSTQKGLSTTQSVTYNSSPYSAGITNSFVYALLMPPVVSVYNPDGSYNYSNPYEYAYFAIGSQTANPVSDLINSVAESINDYLISNVYLQYRFGDLTAKASIGLNREHITQNYFSPSYTSLGLATNGIGGIGNKSNQVWQQEYTLEYIHNFNRKHDINALVGFTRQRTKTNYNSILASHFTNEELKQNNLADASTIYSPESGLTTSTLNSIIGRVNYSLLNRYNATATLRADKSSRFSKGKKWGWFPSVGLSCNVEKEHFLANNQTISFLKVRASVGTVGNQEIGDYEYAQSYSTGQYNGSSSYTKSNNANDNLKWETTASANFGVDFGLWNDRLTVVADMYWKKTSDLLLLVPTGNTFSGVSTQLQNIGNVENRGVEFTVNGAIVQNKNVDFTVSANISHNHNEITSIGNNNQIIQGNQNETVYAKVKL